MSDHKTGSHVTVIHVYILTLMELKIRSSSNIKSHSLFISLLPLARLAVVNGRNVASFIPSFTPPLAPSPLSASALAS